jgi:hypothetical protein
MTETVQLPTKSLTPAAPVRSVALAMIDPMIAMPRADPVVSNVWMSPSPGPDRIWEPVERVGVQGGEDKTEPGTGHQHPGQGRGAAQPIEFGRPEDHPDRRRGEAERDWPLGAELVHPAAAHPGRRRRRVEHRQDREGGSVGSW